MALTVGDVFKRAGGGGSLSIIRKHIIKVFFSSVACQGWKARFIGKRCRRCREENSGIYLAKAMLEGRESREP